MTVLDETQEEDEELSLAAPETRAAGRWNSAGVPTEKSKDFKTAVRRLALLLKPERPILFVVAVVAITSAMLNVLGPRVLGHGTDIIFRGVVTHRGIDFAALHRVLFQADRPLRRVGVPVDPHGIHPRRRRSTIDVPTAIRGGRQAQRPSAALRRQAGPRRSPEPRSPTTSTTSLRACSRRSARCSRPSCCCWACPS